MALPTTLPSKGVTTPSVGSTIDAEEDRREGSVGYLCATDLLCGEKHSLDNLLEVLLRRLLFV